MMKILKVSAQKAGFSRKSKLVAAKTKVLQQALICIFLAVFIFPVYGQDGQIRFDVSGSLDWARGELSARAGFNLSQTGFKLPAGRFAAGETLKEAAPRLLRPFLLALRVDSASTVGDLAERGEVSFAELDVLCNEAEKVPPSLSPDLARMNGSYTVFLDKISALLTRHRRAIEPEKPLLPAQTADYTGIIIIAEEELPVHGRNARAFVEPCLFPKIWDTDMNLVYERNMTEAPGGRERAGIVRYVPPESIFRPTPSGLEGDLASFAGPKPLRILARKVFGISPTDPVIEREDALKILSSEHNRRLLKEGRVILVIKKDSLSAGLEPANP